MKKDWLAAIFAFPSIMLEAVTGIFRRIEEEEKEVLNGAEYDPETDYQQGPEKADS